MNYQELILQGGTGTWILLGWFPLALILALVLGALLAANRRVPPLLLTAVLALPSLVGVVLVLQGWSSMTSELADPDPAAKFSPLALYLSQALVGSLLPGWLVSLPAVVVVFAAALTGIARGPRRFLLPLGVLVLSLGLAALPLVAWQPEEASMVEPLVRSILYGALGIGVAGALVGRNPDSAAPSGGATAAQALPLVVGGLEVASMAWGYLQVFEGMAYVGDGATSLLLAGTDAVAAQQPWSWAALGLALVIAALGTFGSLDRSPRSVARLAGLALVAVPALALWFDGHALMLLLHMSLGR